MAASGGKPLEPGAVVGRRYRLQERLTQGGMGVVWSATHLVTKRRVAIKLLHGAGHDDPASRARLLREARASCAVDHPSVVPVVDVIDAEGAPALVMELLDGESLRARLERQGPLSPRETCSFLAPVAEALAAAHAANIVHRDVKPENIFLAGDREEPVVRVLDFGIAKIVATGEATSNLTETGAMLGTPYYMSPEQAFGERDVGPATDAWALGIVLYECLSGARPTQAENLGQVIKLITQEPLAPIEERVPRLPAALAALVGRLLQREIAAREVDMARVARGLWTCTEEPGAAVSTPPPRARSMRAFTSAAGVALALAIALAWRGVAPRRTTPEPAPAASGPLTTLPAATVSNVAPSPHPSSLPSTAPVAALPARVDAGLPPGLAPGLASRPGTAPPKPAESAAPSAPADDGGATGPGHVIIKPPF